jgi:hypothetical protein
MRRRWMSAATISEGGSARAIPAQS